MALAAPGEYDALPTVTVLRSRPVASFKDHGSIWEIGWNGIWVRATVAVSVDWIDHTPSDSND